MWLLTEAFQIVELWGVFCLLLVCLQETFYFGIIFEGQKCGRDSPESSRLLLNSFLSW